MLSELIATQKQIIVPGVFDGLSARIASAEEFSALYMSGFAVAGTLLGKPDIGLVTATEMIQRAQQVVDASNGIPIIADGDNGYGDEQNVARLVIAYEHAGVSCIQLEDQVSPKRCGHMENKEVVSLDEAVPKIQAAVNTRSSSGFLVMARTDARATHNLDEAITRGKAFLDAGADILFIEAPQSISEMEKIKQAFPNTPLVANMVEDGKTPELDLDTLSQLGFQIVLRPISALLCVASCLQKSYLDLHQSGKLGTEQNRLGFSEYNTLVGLND